MPLLVDTPQQSDTELGQFVPFTHKKKAREHLISLLQHNHRHHRLSKRANNTVSTSTFLHSKKVEYSRNHFRIPIRQQHCLLNCTQHVLGARVHLVREKLTQRQKKRAKQIFQRSHPRIQSDDLSQRQALGITNPPEGRAQ